MRRLYVGFVFLLLGSCGKASETTCSDVFCPGEGRGDCVDLSSDPQHCGECDYGCSPSEACVDGVCIADCGSGEFSCGGNCVDLETDERNCGDCEVECADDESCLGGTCEGSTGCEGDDCGCLEGEGCDCEDGDCACEDGYTQCGRRCIDTSENRRHCGACASPCPGELECVDGVCECPEGTVECWFGCLDPSSDPLNCGACGALCENSTFCEQGACSCPIGLTSCDGTCVDTDTSRFHCGACGTECDLGQTCEAGECQAVPTSACAEQPVNINIERVALYQAVEISLVDDGAVVDPKARKADVVQGRDALVRVFVEPGPDHEATTIVAQLDLVGAQGSTHFSQPTAISFASTPGDLGSTLNIHVPATALTVDLDYSVQLTACDPQPEGTSGLVRVPETGSVPLVARHSGEIDVMFVPIVHDGRVPDTSEVILEAFEREVTRQFPATALNYQVGEPLVSSETGTLPDLGLILDQLTAHRARDQAADHLYYYGIVDPAAALDEYCNGGCTTGIAWFLPSMDDWSIAHRVGVGIGFGTYGANTFAHEIGHTLGRDHAPCNAEGDLFYPYPNAIIGSWGYDKLGGVLKAPDEFSDLMSYCEPNWVSDYNYRAIFQRLAASRVANVRGGPTELVKRVDAEETWASFVVSGTRVKWSRTLTKSGSPPGNPEPGVAYDIEGVPIADIEVHRLFMADGEGYKVFVPEQQPGWFAVGLADGVALPYE